MNEIAGQPQYDPTIYFENHEKQKVKRAEYLLNGYLKKDGSPILGADPALDKLAQDTEREGEAFTGFFLWHESTKHIPPETLAEATQRCQTQQDKLFGKGKVLVRLDPTADAAKIGRGSGYAKGVHPIGTYISKA